MRLLSWLRPVRSCLIPFSSADGLPARRTECAPPPRLSVEHLEDRTVPSTFTVGNLVDSGAGSLRQAVLDA